MKPLPTNEFLKKLGFVGGNPFSETQAEEEDNLSKYFVDLPAFYKILDIDTGKPKSSILGADRGCGKSANRKNVERWLIHGRGDKSLKEKWPWKSPVLVIPYTDFSRLRASVSDDFSKITPEHHVNSILWIGTSRLVAYIEKHWDKINTQNLNEWDITRLGFYLSNFSDRWGKSPENKLKVSQKENKFKTSADLFQFAIAFNNEAEKIKTSGSSGLLKSFSELALALGFQSIVVLVDGVDEIDITADKPESGALLLKPLIAERVLMQMENLTFKFFLPNQIIYALRDFSETRLGERIKYYNIEWNREAIQRMLSQRLSTFSNGKINDLGQIASIDTKDVGNIIANYVENNPRDLLRLAEQVLIKLEENETKTDISKQQTKVPRITNSIIDEAIQYYEDYIAPNNAYSSNKQQVRGSTKWEITPDLHVKYKGKVITTERLDPKEFEILTYFIEHSGERIRRSDIGNAVWKEKWNDKYDWVLSQSILRLRKKIGGKWIKTVRGIGYIFSGE